MNKTPCILCKQTEYTSLLTSYPWGSFDEPRFYEKCRNCSLIRENPEAYSQIEFDIQADPGAMSSEERRQFQFKYGEAMDVVDNAGELYKMYQYDDPLQMSNDLVKRVLRRLPKSQSPSVLEIGCADGFLLRELGKAIPGLTAIGIDPSPISHQRACSLGTDTLLGTIQDIDPERLDNVDVAYAFGNLMLHPDPLDTVNRMCSKLKPDGILVVDVKNSNSLSRQVAKFLAKTPTRNLSPVRNFITRNFTNMRFAFSKKHLEELAKLANLRILELNTLPPRALAYSNGHKGSNGLFRVVWKILDLIDTLRNERAWIELVAVKIK